MPPPPETIELGDYVSVEPTKDVWTVTRIDGAIATLSPASIALAGRPRRIAEVRRLTIVRAAPEPDEF